MRIRASRWAVLIALSAAAALTGFVAGAGEPPERPPLPNDPLLAEQWYLFPADDRHGARGGINALEAWRHVKPAPPVVVAVLDAGVNFTHPDLKANVWANHREVLNFKDDDGNGYVDDVHGWDFASNDGNPTSQAFEGGYDHGTMTAGLIAAVPDNGIGIAGVGRNVHVMPLRVIGEHTSSPDGAVPRAFRYAIRHGARVIVCSIAFGQIQHAMEEPLREAEKAGVLYVQSAGNSAGTSIDEDFKVLGRFRNVLVVGGTTRDGRLSPRLSVGRLVSVAAPAEGMVFPSFGGYERFKGAGTSFAAPIVAAAAGTLWSQKPGLSAEEVIDRVRKASVVEPGMEKVIGGGRLDMARLLKP